MKKSYKGSLFIIACFLVFNLIAMPVFAAEQSTSNPVSGIEEIDGTAGNIGLDTYGTKDSMSLWIPASDFAPRDSSVTYSEPSYGYRYRTGGGSDFTASIKLPNGADIVLLRLFYCDTDATNDIRLWFTRYFGESPPNYEDITSLISDGTPGCTSTYVNTPTSPYTIDNYNNSYHAIIRTYGTTSALRFKGVRIWYKLQVSPAPATATFTDVPTSHPFFQYIEALADSGITTGYSDDTFRPSQYITRGQMAVFLSKALGLHWPE